MAAFDKLVTCMSDIGYSHECAKLWAHAVALTSKLCVSECTTDEAYNGPAPSCSFSSCIKCKDLYVESIFDLYAGRTSQRSGLTSNIAYPCTSFSNVIQDPCDGKVKEYPKPTLAPTAKKSGGSMRVASSSTRILVPMLVLIFSMSC